jgi:hypothetical protein
MKNDPSRVFRDMADVQALLDLPGVDEEKIRGYFEQHGLATASTKSSEPAEELEFPRATPADVEALRRAVGLCRVSPEHYLQFLAQFSASATYESLKARKGPRGEPFRL